MTIQPRQRLGAGGYCVCPKCGHRSPHKRGLPCQDDACAKCGAKLLRVGSYHHQLWLKHTAVAD